MVKTKQTPCGGKSHRPEGMAMAKFDPLGEDTEDSIDLPKVLEDAEPPKEGEPSTSKSKGKTGDLLAQTEEGAEAPPEVTPPDPRPTDPQPGTSTDPPEAPAEVPTEEATKATQKPDKDPPPALTAYIRACKAAGKTW